MGKTMALVKDEQSTEPARIWRETPITKDTVFRGRDACGRSGWFLRLTVTGLYPRRVGPYPTKDAALNVLEEFLANAIVEPFCNLENDMKDPGVYVVEGVPILQGR